MAKQQPKIRTKKTKHPTPTQHSRSHEESLQRVYPKQTGFATRGVVANAAGKTKQPGPPPPPGGQIAFLLRFPAPPPALRVAPLLNGEPSKTPLAQPHHGSSPPPSRRLSLSSSSFRHRFLRRRSPSPVTVASPSPLLVLLSSPWTLATWTNFHVSHSFAGIVTGFASFRKNVDSAREIAILPESMPLFMNLEGRRREKGGGGDRQQRPPFIRHTRGIRGTFRTRKAVKRM